MPRKRTSGGAGPYRRGAAFENRVARAYRKAGHIAQRSPKSASPFDLICIRPEGTVELVQAKLGGYMPPRDRNELIELAAAHNVTPLLVWKDNGLIRRRDLRTGEELASFQDSD